MSKFEDFQSFYCNVFTLWKKCFVSHFFVSLPLKYRF
eukprot:UN13952